MPQLMWKGVVFIAPRFQLIVHEVFFRQTLGARQLRELPMCVFPCLWAISRWCLTSRSDRTLAQVTAEEVTAGISPPL